MPASCVFFYNDTANTEISTLSLDDALSNSQRRPALIGRVIALRRGHRRRRRVHQNDRLTSRRDVAAPVGRSPLPRLCLPPSCSSYQEFRHHHQTVANVGDHLSDETQRLAAM